MARTGDWAEGQGGVEDHDVRPAYLDELVAAYTTDVPLAVGWDCGNGAAGDILPDLIARLPGRHVSLNDVVRSVEQFAQQRAQKARISLRLDCPSDIGTLRADDKRIRQIMINLVSNAISFTQTGDSVTIVARRSANEMQLFVSDTGDGIKPEHQATVFDRFEARAGSDRRRGAGLGLSLVKSFVELHGGWVTLESEPTVGTRVTCHLPLIHTASGENGGKQPELAADL